MNYELKISNAIEDKGKIDLIRLANIAEGITRIAEGALQIRLRGVSSIKGRKKESLKNSIKITLSGIKQGSTILCLETQKFEDTLDSIQLDLFRSEDQIELKNQTPISLFVSAFEDATKRHSGSNLLDKSLLKELRNFKRAFLSGDETFTVSNEGSFDVLELSKQSFDKISHLEDKIPESQPVILNGIVEELKYSKLQVKINTEKGTTNGFLSEGLSAETIAHYWGREITITGTTHFKSDRSSIVEIKQIHRPNIGDSYFSKKPNQGLPIEEQIKDQIEKKSGGNMTSIAGKWPGEETFEELLKLL